MRQRLRSIGIILFFGLFLTLFSLDGISGCGGGSTAGGDEGGIDVGTGIGNALQDALTALDTVGTVVSTSLTVGTSTSLILSVDGGGLKAASIDQHVHCTAGGPANVTGTIDDTGTAGVFDLSVDLGDCDGLNGTLNFDGSFETADDTRNFTVDFTGSVGGNGCLLALDEAGYLFSAALDIIAAPVTESLSGTLTGTCTEPGGTASISCDWGGGANADDAGALLASCTCSGDGCG